MQHKHNGRPQRKDQTKRTGSQYLFRMPPGLRERLQQRADENGRALSSGIIDAMENHLTSADRVTQLWEFFQKYVGEQNARQG